MKLGKYRVWFAQITSNLIVYLVICYFDIDLIFI